MSVIELGNRHINYIVTAAATNPNFAHYHKEIEEPALESNLSKAEKIGQILVDQNYKSYDTRYSEKSDPYQYKHEYIQPFNALQTIKLCDCYHYQAMDTDDYTETDAYKFVQALILHLIKEIDGYNELKWMIL